MSNRQKTLDPAVFTIDDLKTLGTARLSRAYAEYYNEGAMDLVTLRENVAAYNKYRIRPRCLIDVSNPDTSSEIFGAKCSFPLGFSPAAMHKMAHPDGEVATSRAAAKTGICMAVSTYATSSLEEVIEQKKQNPYAVQISIFKDRDITKRIIQDAEKAGYKAIFVSVDLQILGRRLNEMRNDFALPDNLDFPVLKLSSQEVIGGGVTGIEYDPSINWKELIPWLRSITKMEIWLKGVCSAEDVMLAADHGIDGVLISNHGGRQLDSCQATLEVLEEVGERAAGKIQIAVDGGIRRGSDIFKAIALGAKHCFVGRVPIWGLAYNGEEGVELAVDLLYSEFLTTMLLAGCRTVKDITRAHLTERKEPLVEFQAKL